MSFADFLKSKGEKPGVKHAKAEAGKKKKGKKRLAPKRKGK